MSMLRIRLPRNLDIYSSSPCLWQCSVSWCSPDEYKENWTCPALYALGNLGILRAAGFAIVWTAVCHLQQFCSSQCRVVVGTSPRRWPLGMFALSGSSLPGSKYSRSRPTLRFLKRPSQLRVSMRSRSTNPVVVERALSMSLNLAVPSKESTCKLSLPPFGMWFLKYLKQLRL